MNSISFELCHVLSRVTHGLQSASTAGAENRCVRDLGGLERTTDSQQVQEQQDRLRLLSTLNTRLETQLQKVELEGKNEGDRKEKRKTERRDMATQTPRQLDTSNLYQLLTNIAITRLEQLEMHSNHLLSRDPPPANQSSPTISDDVTKATSPVSQPSDDDVHHNDSVMQPSMTPQVKTLTLSHFDIFRKHRSRGRDDVMVAYKGPIRVRHDANTTSTFSRLQLRRNGVTDLHWSSMRDATGTGTGCK